MKYKMKIEKYIDDPKLTWQERYDKLRAHHLEEIKELIKHIEHLEASELEFLHGLRWRGR